MASAQLARMHGMNADHDRFFSDILVAHRMEDAYLFPLERPKLVTLSGV